MIMMLMMQLHNGFISTNCASAGKTTNQSNISWDEGKSPMFGHVFMDCWFYIPITVKSQIYIRQMYPQYNICRTYTQYISTIVVYIYSTVTLQEKRDKKIKQNRSRSLFLQNLAFRCCFLLSFRKISNCTCVYQSIRTLQRFYLSSSGFTIYTAPNHGSIKKQLVIQI